MQLLNDLAICSNDISNDLRKALRIYKNLLYLLLLLRQQQAQQQIINTLKLQLRKRRQAADKLKLALVNSIKDMHHALQLAAAAPAAAPAAAHAPAAAAAANTSSSSSSSSGEAASSS